MSLALSNSNVTDTWGPFPPMNHTKLSGDVRGAVQAAVSFTFGLNLAYVGSRSWENVGSHFGAWPGAKLILHASSLWHASQVVPAQPDGHAQSAFPKAHPTILPLSTLSPNDKQGTSFVHEVEAEGVHAGGSLLRYQWRTPPLRQCRSIEALNVEFKGKYGRYDVAFGWPEGLG